MAAIPESAPGSLETSPRPNPLLGLPFEGAIEALGPAYWDVVEAATFPLTCLRFRNDPRLARLAAEWMAAGSCHGVLNTDNMSLAGESVDDALVPVEALADLPDPVPPTLRRPATAEELEPFVAEAPTPPRAGWLAWRDAWWRWNLPETPIRPVIERIWAAMDERDDWTPLQQWLVRTVSPATTAGA